MDDYKRLYYMHRRDLIGKDFGDVSSRREIREKLKCKSFKWFLDNIYPEKFIPDENVHAYGEVNPSTLSHLSLIHNSVMWEFLCFNVYFL